MNLNNSFKKIKIIIRIKKNTSNPATTRREVASCAKHNTELSGCGAAGAGKDDDDFFRDDFDLRALPVVVATPGAAPISNNFSIKTKNINEKNNDLKLRMKYKQKKNFQKKNNSKCTR